MKFIPVEVKLVLDHDELETISNVITILNNIDKALRDPEKGAFVDVATKAHIDNLDKAIDKIRGHI